MFVWVAALLLQERCRRLWAHLSRLFDTRFTPALGSAHVGWPAPSSVSFSRPWLRFVAFAMLAALVPIAQGLGASVCTSGYTCPHTYRGVDDVLRVSTAVSTVMGDGTGATVDGVGTEAQVNTPKGVAVKGDCTQVLVASQGGHVIRAIDLGSSTVTTLAGTGTGTHTDAVGTNAAFNGPSGIVYTRDDSAALVADTTNNRIRSINLDTLDVTTLAGSGTATHADGTGAAASFNGPLAVAVTTDGVNCLVADTTNHRIRSIVISTGVVTTLAGSGTGTHADGTGAAASFNSPSGIAVSPDGVDAYVADTSNNALRKIVISTGVVTTPAGNIGAASTDGEGAAAGFHTPFGIVMLPDGLSLVMSDSGAPSYAARAVVLASYAVESVAGTGSTGFVDGAGVTAAFNVPSGLAVSSDGLSLFVADATNNRVRKIDLCPTITQQLANPSTVTCPVGYAWAETNTITTIAGSGTAALTDATGAAAAFQNPTALAYSPDGRTAYVADSGNHAIRAINMATTAVTTLAGSGSSGYTDATGASAVFNNPRGLAITPDGVDMYVADTDNHRIRKIVISTGVVTTYAGSGTQSETDATGVAATFDQPQAIVISPDGVNMVVGCISSRLRKIVVATGVVTILAGSGVASSTDGTGTGATLDRVYGMAFLSDGDSLLFTETTQNSLRKIVVSTGVVTTLAGCSAAAGSVDGLSTAACFEGPQQLQVTPDFETALLVDTSFARVRSVDLRGSTYRVSTLAGAVNGMYNAAASLALLNTPVGAAISPDGLTLLFTETANDRVRSLEICALVAETRLTADRELLLERSGGGTEDDALRQFGEEKTVALDGDTLAVGSFLTTPACAGSSAGGSAVAGCILDYRMAEQLVDWFGEYEWKFAYSGSVNGFTEAAFQTAMASYATNPTISIAYNYQTASVDSGAYVFGGYTSQSWSRIDRCADSTHTGGTGTTDSCNHWVTCASQATCNTYAICDCDTDCGNPGPCPGSTGPDCGCATQCKCCSTDPTCTAVCSHVSDTAAALFTLMVADTHSFAKYDDSGTGQDIYTCDTTGPTFGPQSTGTAGKSPYGNFALDFQLTSKVVATGNYGYGVPGTDWAKSGVTSLTLNEVEVFALASRLQYRSLFHFAPSGFGSTGDGSVHVFYRNKASGAFSANAWGHLKRVVLPSYLDKYLYGWSVALDVNTMVVGRRGNRDIYIHERHRSDCTHVGSMANGALCSNHGAGYSADNWGVVQTLSWPGSATTATWTGEASSSVYGGIQEQGNTLSCTAVQALTLCTAPTGTPTLVVGEWGVSVDLSGDWLIVGAYKSSATAGTYTGAAFLYHRTAATSDFMYKQALIGVTTSNAHCGWDVAISGNYAVVGCYGASGTAGQVSFYENEQPDGYSSGSPAYGQDVHGGWSLFVTRTATACTNPPSCTTTSSDSAAGDFFGYSVDICGTTAVVGAFGISPAVGVAKTSQGAVYVFERNWDTSFSGTTGSMWAISKKIVAPDAGAGANFGFKVVIDGSYILVTAHKAEDNGEGYLFGRNFGGVNNWGYIKSLKQPVVSATPGFTSNAGSNGYLLNYWADGQGSHASALQKAHGVPYWSDYTTTATTISPGFGRSAGLSGNTGVIGAPFGDLDATLATSDTGTISVFSVLPQHAHNPPHFGEIVFSGSDVSSRDLFGSAVHITADGSLFVVGAREATHTSIQNAGAVYVYRRSATGAVTQLAKLTPAAPVLDSRFGASIASLLFRFPSDKDEASQELLIGAPGHDNVDYPAYPMQEAASQAQYRSGAVYVFTKSDQWGETTLASGIAASATSITVTSALDLMGVSTTGVINIGMNTVTITGVNFNTNVLTASPGVTYAELAGAICIAKQYGTHTNAGFREAEKLTAQSTSCGQGGPDFGAIWNQYSGTQTHESGYLPTSVTLQQAITQAGTPDEEICVSSAANLLGSFGVGGTAPITPGDADDVIMWVRIGDANNNPAVALKNTMVIGTCATGGTNSWGSTVTGDLIKIVSSTLTADQAIGGTVYVYPEPFFSVANPFPSCFGSEYVTSGRQPGGETTIATSASGGTLATATEFSGGYAYAVGGSSITVQDASRLFMVDTFGLVDTGTSTTTLTLAATASATAGYYVGWDITIDLDGETQTTGDVETRSIVGHTSARVISVDSVFTSTPTTASIYHISRWQTRPYVATGYNPVVTVTGVNFVTGVLTVSAGLVSAGYINDPVRLATPSSTKMHLEATSPSVKDLYVSSSIHIVQGKGTGQSRRITAYDGFDKVVTVSSAWIIWPDSTSEYVITGKPLCVNDCKDNSFGSAVAVGKTDTADRHVMAVGAPMADSHSYCVTYDDRGRSCTATQTPLYQSGRVYVYERQGNVTKHRWKLTQILEAPAVGATANTQGDAGPGAQLERAPAAAHEAASYDHFGHAVGVLRDTIFVGAPNSGTTDVGAVFVFERAYHVYLRGITVDCTVACTTTTFSMAVVPAAAPYDQAPVEDYYVGYSVTIGDETRVVSGYTISGGGGTSNYGEGGNPIFTVSQAFSFTPTNAMTFTLHSGVSGTKGLANKWGFKQVITPASAAAADLFGFSLDVASNLLVVGAPGKDVTLTNLVNKMTDVGTVYVFQQNAGVVNGREQKRWTEAQHLTQTSDTAVDTGIRSRMGQSVAIDGAGTTIAAGGPAYDSEGHDPGVNFAHSGQTRGEAALPGAGSVVLFRKQHVEGVTTVSADFAVGATSISVASATDLLGTDTVGTIQIGQNPAIEVAAVTGNTLTVTAETVMFASTRVADSLESARAVRSSSWRKDELYASSQAVTGGSFGSSVDLADDGALLVGSPHGEMEVGCCGSVENIGTRAGTAHVMQASRVNASLDFYGKDIDSGTVAAVSTTLLTLAQSASNLEDAYVDMNLVIGADTRQIVKYAASTRQATVDAVFSVTVTAGTTTYSVVDPKTFTQPINDENYPGESCQTLLGEGYNSSGYYWLRSRFTNNTGARSAFVGYCDQATDGGGWLMCYTDDGSVDIAHEYGYDGKHPYASRGYRSDCRNIPFNEVMYASNVGSPALVTDDVVIFKAEGRRPILAADSLWQGNPAQDTYGKLTFKAYSPWTGPDKSMSYQLLMCGSGHGTGFFMSGLFVTTTCTDGWKTCTSWCKDLTSDYYRQSYSPKENYMYSVPVNFTGVAFRENGHKRMPRRLMSVGIRATGTQCQSGWQRYGVYCKCPALQYRKDQVVYWRFEDGTPDATVSALIEDVRRVSTQRVDDTATLSALGSGGITTLSLNNDLEYVTATVPEHTDYAPVNATFAALCLPNKGAIEFSGAQQLRTTRYADMNTLSLSTGFTWEVSVYFKSLGSQEAIMQWSNGGGSNYMMLSKTATNGIQFDVVHASATVSAVTNFQLLANTWYHLAVTYDGGVAGQIRIFHANTYGADVTSSDCEDEVCMVGKVYGTIGEVGSGLGDGLQLGTGTMSGCTAGMTISASGGGICSSASPSGYVGIDCTVDGDCGSGGTCDLGSDFEATITAVSGGAITAVYVTNPGVSYFSTPSLVISSAACTCGGAAGNVAGNFATCMTVATTMGKATLKSRQWVHLQTAAAKWDSFTGWANSGDSSACTSASTDPCPWVSILSTLTTGWRWYLGRTAAGTLDMNGYVDEVRVHSRALDLAGESLWRP